MKQKLIALKNNITTNKSTWLMAIINIIASGIIVTGGIDINKNTSEISSNKESTGILHKRISSQDVEIGKLTEQIKSLREDRNEDRETIKALNIRIDNLMKK